MTSGRTSARPLRLPPALLAFATSRLGAVTSVTDLSWEHAESAVWAVTAESGRAVLKSYRQPRKHAQELAAYTDWLPLLRRRLPDGAATPELLGADVPAHALLFSFEEGQLLQNLTLPRQRQLQLHRLAGVALGQLHRLPVADHDPLPLSAAYLQRLEAWTARAAGLVPAPVLKNIGSAASQAAPFLQALKRVPCHRDYTPRNWLVGPRQDRLIVIDFEHARPDLHLVDLQRLWVGPWRQHPDLRESFLEGYGRQLSADEEEALRAISALWALSTIVWARQHDDLTFAEEAWEVVRWLELGGWDP